MASDTTQCFAMAYVPTWRERFWRKLGFRHHRGEEPRDVDAMPGWMNTATCFSFSFTDRLRLLLTGRLLISTISHTDTPSPMTIKNRVDWQIYAPGQPR